MSDLVERAPYNIKYDTSNCDEEPIHFIRHVQSVACLIVVSSDSLNISHLSDNTSLFFNRAPHELLGQPLSTVMPVTIMERLKDGIEEGSFQFVNPLWLSVESSDGFKKYELFVHFSPQKDKLYLEVEPADEKVNDLGFLSLIDNIILQLQQQSSKQGLLENATNAIKRITGFDRVMAYEFSDDGHGKVVAEAKEQDMEPFLGLNYPASDIPPQARKLYKNNRIRLISDVEASPALVLHQQGDEYRQPLDLSCTVYRGSSPIHLEYLTNMGVRSSMSIAIINDDNLWGLFACHHREARLVGYKQRTMLQLLGKVISGQLQLLAINQYRERELAAEMNRSKLYEKMSSNWDIGQALVGKEPNMLSLISAGGAAVMVEGDVICLGKCLKKKDILELSDWLSSRVQEGELFHTTALSEVYPKAEEYRDLASGILSICISSEHKEFLFWFRPETAQEVNWAGNPEMDKSAQFYDGRLHPRASFEVWKQVIKGHSPPWEPFEIKNAVAVRDNIKEVILHKYEVLKKANQELAHAFEDLETFSYSVSHDLKAPLRHIKSFAQILVEDFHGRFNQEALELMNIIMSSADRMDDFIEDLLHFSKASKVFLSQSDVDVSYYAQKAFEEASATDPKKENIKFTIQENMPALYADGRLFQQVMQNLIGNAIKYTRNRDERRIHISTESANGETVIMVQDNGIGMSEDDAREVFLPFRRSKSAESFEGTGIGLSIVKRIVERHGGRSWATSEPGKGATFYCAFPDEKA
jgi:light-regulated signal transduction histidine kinase (bacteriophytochrome)